MAAKVRLIIFPGNFVPHVGGLETHVDEFAKYLSKNSKYKITIFSPNVVGAKEKEIIHGRVKVIRYPAVEIVKNFPIPKFWTPVFWQLYFGLYKNKYDIVMTRTRFFTNSTLGMVFSKFRLRRIKLIHVEHGSEFVKLESKFKCFVAYCYDMVFGKLLFVLSDKNVAISDVVKRFVCKHFVRNSDSVPVIRRGVDFEIYKEAKVDAKVKREFEGKLVMTFLGRLYKWKGVSKSIEAYKKLPLDVQKKVVFLIVGDGEDFERLKRAALGHLDKGIYMLGRVEFKKAISILKATDIYVHSAYPGGGLSNSLLQAMKCGCCVVASPHEGAREVVANGKTGILLNDNKVKSIKTGIIELVENDGLREAYSKQAKKYIDENFSWEKVVAEYEAVFDEVLRKY